jgi:hypothetical protein
LLNRFFIFCYLVATTNHNDDMPKNPHDSGSAQKMEAFFVKHGEKLLERMAKEKAP